MSTPRYCDSQVAPDCPSKPPLNGVFSELAEDWTTLSGTQFKRNADGKRIQVEVDRDSCPACSLWQAGQHESQVNARKSITVATERGYDPDYVAWLESQVQKPIVPDETPAEVA